MPTFRIIGPTLLSTRFVKSNFITLSLLIAGIWLFNINAVAQCGSWSTVGSAGFSAGDALPTSLAINGSGTPYVAYPDVTNSNKATVMKYNGSSWVVVGIAGFSAGAAGYPSLAIDGSGTPYIAYQDSANGYKATVMKYNGSSWVVVGSAGFSSGAANTSLAIDGSGTPYIAFSDLDHSWKATVMKYNGSSWVVVGTPDFSAGEADWTFLALNGSGTPYVAYRDQGNSWKATVMKYNGSSWVVVGSAGFSTGGAHNTSLAIDGSGTPYIAYSDSANGYKATVMKYNGSSWVVVGSAGFSAGVTQYTSINIDGSGIPYVAYSDFVSSQKATVMRYNGTSWVVVGSVGFSVAEADCVSLAINGSGTPYIAYRDWGYSGKATVMKLVTVSVITGTTSVCMGDTTTLSDSTAGGTWSSSNTAIATVGTAGMVVGITAGAATITYMLGGCYSTAAITVNPLPVAGTITGASSVCVSSTITLTDATTGGVWSSSNSTATVLAGVVSGVSAGIDTISYSVTNTCGTATATKTITINPLPLAGTITGASSVCVSSTITLTDTTTGGTWISSNATATVLAGVVSGVSAGTDTINYSVTNTCGTVTATKIITVNPLPVAGTITGASSVCVSSTITLTDATTGGVWSSSNSTATVLAGVVSGVSAGTDTINYSVSNMCGIETATIVITINPLPDAGTIIGSDSVCVGDSITVSNTSSGGSWSTIIGNATIVSGVLTGVAAGVDTIVYSVTNTCGTATTEKTIEIIDCVSEVKSISELMENTLYPNPTQNRIIITSSVPIKKVEISNLLGQTVFSGVYNAKEVVVSLNQLSTGMYVVKVNDTKVYKVVKE